MCGDRHTPETCEFGRQTATGEIFDPAEPHVAVHLPKRKRLRPGTLVCLRGAHNQPVNLKITDKKGSPGYDLSPAALELLGYVPTKHWSGVVRLC